MKKMRKIEKKNSNFNHDDENENPRAITIGTGCSGMDVPILAMQKLKI